jgi:hypothetical protein
LNSASVISLHITLTAKLQIKQLLIDNGAENADDEPKEDVNTDMSAIVPTHIISMDVLFAGYDTAIENKIAVVTVRILHYHLKTRECYSFF